MIQAPGLIKAVLLIAVQQSVVIPSVIVLKIVTLFFVIILNVLAPKAGPETNF